MRLPSFKRINKSDFSADEQAMIETLAASLNIGIESLYTAINNNLTFKDNFAGTQVDLIVTVDSNGIPQGTTTFQLKNTNKVIGCNVKFEQNLTNSDTYPTSAPFITFQQNGNIITILHITGLSPNDEHLLRIQAEN